MAAPHHCKALGIEDFNDPVLVELIRDVWRGSVEAAPDFPRGHEHRKQWEVAMALRALREGGALREGSEVLGVGAGFEPTIFVLTRHCRRVFATDLYLDPEQWGEANRLMLTDPRACFNQDWNPRRLVVQHMDALDLAYEDESFDAIFSSSSIEHFGGPEEVRRAMAEMFRVLKPGGVASISTEFLVDGEVPADLGILIFDAGQVESVLVEGIGWEPLDAFDGDVSAATSDSAISLADALRPPPDNPIGAPSVAHVALRHEGCLFTSCHLALRKPG